MLYTPVHPGYDILWSPKRKWGVCLWTTVVGLTVLIYASFKRRRVSTVTETVSTLYTIILVAFWLTLSCFVLAIIARFFTYSPTYAKRCYERFRECYNTVNLCRLRFEDRAYDAFLRIKKLFPSWPKRRRGKRTSSHKGKYRRQLGSQDKYKIGTAGSSPEHQELVSKDDDYDDSAARSGNLQFVVNNANTLTEAMRISSDGKVGIGTTAPSSMLHLYTTTNTDKLTIESTEAGATIQGFGISM